jgi:hypothetical protein
MNGAIPFFLAVGSCPTLTVKGSYLTDSCQIFVSSELCHEHHFARFLPDPISPEYKAILLTINTYEFIGVGIRAGALNEEIYKRLRWSMVIRDWEAFEGFIAEFRKQHERDSFFQEFEWLYRRWKNSPLAVDKN